MPRKADPLRAQIKALEANIRADKAERRASEKPLRDARNRLAARLRGLERTLATAEARRARWLSSFWITDEQVAARCYGTSWSDNEALLARSTAALADTTLTLDLFNAQHPELT